MNQDVVESGGDHRPAVGGESIDSVARARVYTIIYGKKGFNFQVFESTIDCLPALPSIARTKDPPTESSGIDGAIFPCGERQNKWIGHTLARLRPVDTAILAAKETKAK